jgi:hypothetical protein
MDLVNNCHGMYLTWVVLVDCEFLLLTSALVLATTKLQLLIFLPQSPFSGLIDTVCDDDDVE